MLRIVRQILTFLLLGALLTVVSAWAIHGVQFWQSRATHAQQVNPAVDYGIQLAFAWLDEEASSDPKLGVRGIGDALWRRHARPHRTSFDLPKSPCPSNDLFSFVRSRWGWSVGESHVLLWSPSTQEGGLQSIVFTSVGWPWLSLETGWHSASDVATFNDMTTPLLSLSGGVEIWRDSPNPEPYSSPYINAFGPLARFALPLFPLWPGFALNTLLFAATLAVLWHVPVGVRRMSRWRAGRCLACGYSIEGLDTCPECGKPTVTTEP